LNFNTVTLVEGEDKVNDNLKLSLFLLGAFLFIASSFYFGETHKPDRFPASVEVSEKVEPLKNDHARITADEWNNENKYRER